MKHEEGEIDQKKQNQHCVPRKKSLSNYLSMPIAL
jgi:hypothetical protein